MDTETQQAAEAVYSGAILDGIKMGYVALWQKCPHLGCKVLFVEPHSGLSAHVTVPSTTESERKGRTRAARHGPVSGHYRRRQSSY